MGSAGGKDGMERRTERIELVVQEEKIKWKGKEEGLNGQCRMKRDGMERKRERIEWVVQEEKMEWNGKKEGLNGQCKRKRWNGKEKRKD